MRIETEEGPSRLEERLEAFKDPETGHIILSPEQAKDSLLESLLSFYRVSVWRFMPTVEVLARIAEAEGEEGIDFTKALEEFKKKTEEEFKAEEERKYGEGGSNIIVPTPRVREI